MIIRVIKTFFAERFNSFLKKRIPASNTQKLSNRNLFIIPTKFGFSYLLTVFVIFLLGTNYQNNLILLASYLFGSLFLTGMLHSFYNLSRLTLTLAGPVTAYAGQQVEVPILLNTERNRFDLTFNYSNNRQYHQVSIEEGESTVNIPFLAVHRGINKTGRLKVSSEYVFGLFICWTNLDFNCAVTTYPAKKNFNHLTLNSSSQHEENNGNIISEGGDDFGELRQYKQGESNAQIAWKQLARGQGRLTKTTQQELGSTPWLSFEQLPPAPIEVKLQMLCYLILDHHKHVTPFGLSLNSTSIDAGASNAHTQQCLHVLAHYKNTQQKSVEENTDV